MDPLSSPIVEALKLRPVQPANSGLSGLLRDGLVVAGEVLEIFEGTAFLSLGGRRVAAETDVELQAGQRFLARVDRGPESIVLRLLQGAQEAELPLVAALRTALADHAAAGTLLTRLVADLRAALASRPPAEVLAGRDGTTQDRSTSPVEKLLARLAGHVQAPTADGGALASALARSGLFHEALLLRGKPERQLALEDLKSILLQALDDLPAGRESESVRRALGGIEAEQLLDVARSQSGDARQVSFALPDGAAWADAQIVVDPEAQNRSEARGAGRDKSTSVDVTVDFSKLGPVKAELRLEGDTLRVRFLVSSPDVAERLAADQAELCADLGRDLDASGGRTARLSVALVDAQSIARSDRPADVRFLGEHLLVDRTA